MQCPTCKGSGKETIKTSEAGGPWRLIQIGCIDCDGKGELTPERHARNLKQEAAWCHCGHGKDTYHDSGDYSTCNKCGKITYVG